MQNYRSKSETAIIIAGCLNFRRFQFFFAVSVCTLWALDFFRRFVGFFRRFVGVFRRFKIGKHMLMTKNAKIVWQQKKVPPAIIPEKAIILHTLEDAGITHAAVTTRNLDAATPLRSANNELQNAIELRTQAAQNATICSSKTESRRRSGKTSILKHLSKRNFNRKMTSAKIEKFCGQSSIRSFQVAITIRFTTFS